MCLCLVQENVTYFLQFEQAAREDDACCTLFERGRITFSACYKVSLVVLSWKKKMAVLTEAAHASRVVGRTCKNSVVDRFC